MKKLFLSTFTRDALSTPLPVSISYLWNFGSLLGFCLFSQILSGLFLSFHYISSMEMAFESVMALENEVWGGWLIRSVHSNGATLFFFLIYLHIARGIFFASFKITAPWIVGVSILLTLMGVAFMGYVLPWGQMSFWGATVITSLISAFPGGDSLVVWVWGGYSVSGPTLTRFYSIHFILPFLILFLSVVHIVFLHSSGSSNPLGLANDSYKISFHPYFSIKDLLGVWIVVAPFIIVSVLFPDLFMDPDNWIPANPLMTPSHIKPEWYFLFAYTILRAIPNKLGGVLGLVFSVLILVIFPILNGSTSKHSLLKKIIFWVLIGNFACLTLLGGMPAGSEDLLFLSQISSFSYFILMLLSSVLLWDSSLKDDF